MPFLPPEALADEDSLACATRRAIELAREGRGRAGLMLATRARRHAQSLETQSGEIDALNAAAIVHLMRGDAIGAAAVAIDVLDLAGRNGDAAQVGHARVSLAMSRMVLGLPGDHCAVLADIVAGAHVSPWLEIRARVGLGIALGDAARFDEAEAEFRAALSITRTHESATTPARIVANLANLGRKRAARESSASEVALACDDGIFHAQWAWALSIEERSIATVLDALGIHGVLLVQRGRARDGILLLRQAVTTGRSHGCRTPLAWILCELGKLLLAEGDVEGAREAYGEALEIAVPLTPSRYVEAACAGLAAVEQRAGDEVAARRWQQRACSESSAHRRACDHLKFVA